MKNVTVFRAALAASVMSIVVPATAVADSCIDQQKATCALFFPEGTSQWATCVENLIAVACYAPTEKVAEGDLAKLVSTVSDYTLPLAETAAMTIPPVELELEAREVVVEAS